MIVLSKEELQNFLDTEEVTFTFGNGENRIDISPALSITFGKNDSVEIKHVGYEIIRYENDEIVFQESLDAFEKALEYLSDFISPDGKITADKIGGFETIDEFYDEKKFNNATMGELLEKYSDCDEFSLTGYTSEKITSEKANEIAERERKIAEEECKRLYDKENEGGLPPFETLLKDVREECAEFTVKKRKRFPEKKYGKYIASFICDFVMDEKTKYYGQDFLWHFYSVLGRECDNIAYINDRVLSGSADDDVFAESDCEFLRDKVLRVETGFENHCTQTSELMKTYYFPLNEKTKEWLLTKKDDYDFEFDFADLAFYKNGKLRFSSCTHERFHNDIKE